MAGDIATISLKVNTSDVERGSNELDKFADAAADAAKGADNFGTSGKVAAKVSAEVAREVEDTHRRVREFTEGLKQNEASTKGAAQATAQQQQELRTLLTQINPVTAAFEKLDNMEQQLSRFNAKGLIDSDTFREAARTIQQTRDELGRAAEARTAEGRAAAAAAQQDKAAATAKENYLQRLREQIELQGKTASEIQEYRAAQLGVTQQAAPLIAKLREQEGAWKTGAISAGQYRQAMRQLPAQFTDIATSIAGGMPLWLVLTQQGGQISDSFGGLGNIFEIIKEKLFGLNDANDEASDSLSDSANGLSENAENAEKLASFLSPVKLGVLALAVAATTMAIAWYQGAKELDEFNKSLILTGNFAGTTASNLSMMAKSIAASTGTTISVSADTLAKLNTTGNYTANQLRTVTAAVVSMSDATGEATATLIADFNSLSKSPLASITQLNDQYHFLTASTYSQIAALEQQGRTQEAANLAIDTYAQVVSKRSEEIADNLGILQSAWKALGDAASGAWDSMLNLGRQKSLDDQLKEALARTKAASGGASTLALGGVDTDTGTSDAARIRGQMLLADLTAAQNKAENDSREKNLSLAKQISDIDQKTLSNAEKRTKQISLINEALTRGVIKQEQAARLITNVNNSFKDPKTPKGSTKAYQDDAGTRELLASQQRLAALKDQVSASATLTSQEQQLSKFTQQIADLKSKTILTADQKSLLARAGEITASLQLEAQLSRENVQREKAVKALKQMQDYTTSIVSKNAQTQEKFGLTTKQAGRVDQQTQLDNTFRKQTDGITDPAALSKVTDEYNRAKEALRSGWDQEDANQGDWLAGMNQGIAQFGENASDVFTATGQLAQTTLSDMASMMTTLATTGKANVKDFAKSFLTSIVDIINKLLLAQAVQAAMGWISSSFSAGTGTATAASNSSFSSGSYSGLSFDSGGYTGEGDKLAPAGIVHRGEFVMTKEATSRIGVDNLYSMMRGYADGGLVGGNAGMFGLSGGQSNSTVVQTSVVVQTGNNQQQTSGNSDAIGKAYQQVIDQSVRDGIAKALRPGGLIYNANNSR